MTIHSHIHKHRINVLLLITAFSLVFMLFFGRIPQDPFYHQFADTRKILCIPNFWNVVSNLPFLLVGIYGLARSRYLAAPQCKNGYIAVCSGIFLVGFGSAFYHINPSTYSLLWDRLPMTIAFMALFSMLLEERVMTDFNVPVLWFFLSLGLGAVGYWYWTEIQGVGDLRIYVLVQFLPMLLIPLILWLFDRNHLNGHLLVCALIFYVVAKLAEYLDAEIFNATQLLSGHTVKHLLASIAAFYIILAVTVKE
jgi:hypothetical protein